MPDLKELYTNFQQRNLNGWGALSNAISHPIDMASGVLSGIGHVAKSIGSLAMDIPQAFMPTGVTLPWSASGAIVPEGTPDPKNVNNTPAAAEWKQRLAMVLNVPGLGIPKAFAEEYANTGSFDSAAGHVITDILPLKEAEKVVTGEDPNSPGVQLTPEQVGENLFTGLLKTVPLVKGIRTARAAFNKGTLPEVPGPTLRSTYEMAGEDAASADANLQALAKIKNVQSKIDSLDKSALPETAIDLAKELSDAHKELLTINNFPPELTSRFLSTIPNNVLADTVMQEMTRAIGEGGEVSRISKIAIDLLQDNPIATEGVVDIIREAGMGPAEAAATVPLIAKGMLQGATNSGKILKIYSDLRDGVMSKILADHPEVASQLKQISDAFGYKNEPTTRWQKFKAQWSNIEDIRRGLAVSSPVTAARNFGVGGLNLASQLFDDLVFGAETYASGKIRQLQGRLGPGEVPTLAQSYAPLMDKLLTLQEITMGGATNPKEWWSRMVKGEANPGLLTTVEAGMQGMTEAYPGVKVRVFNSPVDDFPVINFFSGNFKQGIGRIKQAYQDVDTASDFMKTTISMANTFNTMQEMFWRKFYFTSRLRENVRRFGFESPEQYFEKLKESKENTPRYFGEKHTLESINQLKSSGELQKRIDNLLTDRLQYAKNQKGYSLSEREIKILDKKHSEELPGIQKSLSELEAKLQAGEDWQTAASRTSPEVAKILNGTIDKQDWVVRDAMTHAMKQTFAYTPQFGDFGYSVMKAFQDIPMLYTLATPFPRFLINSSQWLLDHNPLALAKIANPKFMDTIAKAAADPTSIRNPRSIAEFRQAHTGAVLWASAHAIHNSELSGPKYYQIKIGKDEDGNEMYADMRPYNPMSQYLFIEHTMKALARGEQPNLTSGELTEALLGMRRLGEVPVFAFPDIVRQIDSSNPDAFFNSLKPLVGQYMAGYFTPFRIGGDVAGAFGLKEAVQNKDVSGNELLGPAMNQVPVLRNALPARVDPFTGKVSGGEAPGLRLLGPNAHAQTKLEQEVMRTGMPLNDLLGNFADPEADRLVRKNIGEILGTRLENGQLLANVLGEAVKSATADQPMEIKKTLVREIFKSLREQAKNKAMAENPYAFIEHEIRQRPEAERPILRKGLAELNKEKARLMQR